MYLVICRNILLKNLHSLLMKKFYRKYCNWMTPLLPGFFGWCLTWGWGNELSMGALTDEKIDLLGIYFQGDSSQFL